MAPAAAWRIAFVTLTFLLLWRVIQVNAVAYEDTNRPVQRLPTEEPARSAALRAALGSNPADVASLVLLGALQGSADDRAAARAFDAAIGIAPIDRMALRAAAAQDVRQGRVADAVGRIDQLLRHYADSREWAFPLLAKWMAVPEARAALEALAARPSSWMGSFVMTMCRDVDPLLVGALLSRRASTGLAQREEIACVTDRMRAAGHWDAAYQLWLNTLPRDRLSDVGNVFNGSFEHAPSGVGFDWIGHDRGPAQLVDYPAVNGAEGRRAMRVTWTGKPGAGPAVWQFLALAPGRYELTGLARPEGLQSVRGVQWTLRCATEKGVRLGSTSRFLGSSEWARFSVAVEVPRQCAGQVLQLEPVGMGEGTIFVSGKAWFDDLRLTRAN